MKRAFKALLTLAALAGLGWAGWIGMNRYQQGDTITLPVVQVRVGEFVVIVPCRGEVKANRSAQVYSPFTPNLRISWIAGAGELVHEGDPLFRFDSSTGQQDLIQKEAVLRQAQATLDQAVAQSHITSEHDQADVVDATYQVELAKIKTATNEFVPRLEAQRNEIDLTVAEQKSKVQTATTEQHKASDVAKMASLTRQRDLAQADVDLTKSRFEHMEVTSPLTGYFIVGTNNNSATLTSNGQPYKVGDTVGAGLNLAVIPDMASLVVDVKLEEIDRGRVSVGNDVRIHIDALPELKIPAKLTQISPLAEISLEGAIARNFRAYAALSSTDARLRPGMNAGMDVIINRIPNAIAVPAKAIFTQDGKPIVYLQEKETYRAVPVEVLARNPDEVAIAGIPADSAVALVEPKAAGKGSGK